MSWLENISETDGRQIILILSQVVHLLDFPLVSLSLSVSLRSQLSTEAEILTERQIYSLAWPPVKTNRVRNTAGWPGCIGRRENCGRLWSLSEESLFDLLESAGGLVSGLPL